jgi:hypothetical protein
VREDRAFTTKLTKGHEGRKEEERIIEEARRLAVAPSI